MATQRHALVQGNLDATRHARLDALPGWVWDTREASWEEHFAALQRFVEREGHARVPRAQQEGDYKLGGWVNNQRQTYRRGELDEARRARLDALPGWEWNPGRKGQPS